jgi:signal peptidase
MDILVALLAVFIILLLLWTYTGQWFEAPMVAIESGSMEHPNPPFGRMGTIDAGDMVLVQTTDTIDDIVTHGSAQSNEGWKSYGDYGDVVIYKPLGKEGVPQIIHRAMCWVEINKEGNTTTYTIAEYGIFNEETLTIPYLGLNNKRPAPAWTHSGFLTMGDNNNIIDQVSSICPQPLKIEWISGKARLEIPWLGTINLFFDDILYGKDTVSNVHEDSLICLGILLAIFISIPIALDVKDYIIEKKKNKQSNL